MKIGFFSDFYLPHPDGVSYSIESFRVELEKLGHEVYIIAPAPNLRYRDKISRIIRFPAVKGLFFDDYLTSLFFPPQAVSRIDKLGLDIVHYHTPSQIGLLGAYYAIRGKTPLVTTYHTDMYEYVKHYPSVLPGNIALSLLAPIIVGGSRESFRSSMSSIKPERNVDRWNQKIVEQGLTMIHNHCDLVIAPSRKMKNQLLAWHTRTPIEVLPTGVDRITTTDEEIRRAKHHYGIADKDEVILFVGRVGGEKNPVLLMRAFEQLAGKHPYAKLMVVGEGPDLEELSDQARSSIHSTRIIFTGRIDHDKLGAIYGLAAVFAFPSLTDTQGLVLNEAAAAGLPIVMIDELITEVVKDGQNGLLARAVPRDFAAKITTLLDDPTLRLQMGTRGRTLAAKYSSARQAAKLAALYAEVIARHPAKVKTSKRFSFNRKA